MTRHLLVLALAACTFPTPSEQYACDVTSDCTAGRTCDRGFCVIGSGPQDAMPDTLDDAPAIDCTELGSRHFDACMLPAPTGGLTLSLPGVYTYNTASATLTDPVGNVTMVPNVMVASGLVISISGLMVSQGTTLRVVGSQPLIVASWSSISVAGIVDASSAATLDGAGANPAGCATHAAAPGIGDTNGGGGGGGGGFGGAGGRGGNGDGRPGGVGGTAIAQPLLLGGCAGNRGGTADQLGGLGGSGGGAIQLTARLEITIAGTVTAGGAGGKGAPMPGNAGGGGAGSGGMIGLEAPMVMVAATGVLAANGGGGGQGARQAALGATGLDGLPSAMRAAGGAANGAGGPGGPGSGGLVVLGGMGQPDGNDGGGGGGGGAGFITIKSPTQTVGSTAVVSPAAQIVP